MSKIDRERIERTKERRCNLAPWERAWLDAHDGALCAVLPAFMLVKTWVDGEGNHVTSMEDRIRMADIAAAKVAWTRLRWDNPGLYADLHGGAKPLVSA